MYSHNGLPFSTFDVDNDNRSTAIPFGQLDLDSILSKHLTAQGPNTDGRVTEKNLKDKRSQLKYISGMESLQKEVVPDCTRSTLLAINQNG